MVEEENFEKRLKEVTKPRKAPWEERLEEVTGPQVDEVHKAERQLKKYGIEQPPVPEVEIEKITTRLSEAKVDITYAEDYAKAGDYEGSHRHISRAHKRLREAARLLGYSPSEPVEGGESEQSSSSPSLEEMKALGTALKLYDNVRLVDDVAADWKMWRETKFEELDEHQKEWYMDSKTKWEKRVERLKKRVTRFIDKYGVSPILRFEDRNVTVGFDSPQAKGYKTYILSEPEMFKELALPYRDVAPPTPTILRPLTIEDMERLEGWFTEELRKARLEPAKFMQEFLDKVDELKYIPYEKVKKELEPWVESIKWEYRPRPGEIWDLRPGATTVMYYEPREWIYAGDYLHVKKEDIDHNVKRLVEVWKKHGVAVSRAWGVSKNYDPDSVHILTTDKEWDGGWVDGIKVMFWEPKAYITGSPWLKFRPLKELTTPPPPPVVSERARLRKIGEEAIAELERL